MNLWTKALVVLIVANTLSGYQRKGSNIIRLRNGLVNCTSEPTPDLHMIGKCMDDKYGVTDAEREYGESPKFCCTSVNMVCPWFEFFRKECQTVNGFEEWALSAAEDNLRDRCTIRGYTPSQEFCGPFIVTVVKEECSKYEYSECVDSQHNYKSEAVTVEPEEPIRAEGEKTTTPGNTVQRLGLSLSVVIALVSIFLLI